MVNTWLEDCQRNTQVGVGVFPGYSRTLHKDGVETRFVGAVVSLETGVSWGLSGDKG